MKKTENQAFRFHFKPVDREHRSLVHRWLKEPHVAKWFYGQGRGSGKGKYLMAHCEQELKQRGVTLFQTEASPNAYLFYKKLGHIDMPFNNPDGEATHPDDRAMGKYL